MNAGGSGILGGVLGYVAVQLLVGFWVSRRIRSEQDYLVAGRRLGPGLALFSVFATWFGAETCIGSAGALYEHGLAGGSSDPFGYAACLLLLGALLAVPLWRRRLTTLADLLRERFSPRVERLTVLVMVPSSVLWAAAQIRAFGQVLATSSSLQIELAVTVSAAVAVAYTVSGGLLADVVTDLVQGIVVILGLAALGAVVLATAGAADAFAAVPVERLNPLGRGAGWVASLEAWVVPIGGSLVAQEMVSRVVAARSERVARAATLGAAGLYLAVGLIPAALGLIGPSLLPGLADPERILPALALRYLPTWLYVLFAGALVSAILSTVDSALLAASSLVSHNVIVSLHPELGDRARILCARAGVVVFGVVAWALAVHGGGVHELVKQASSFGSGGVLVVVLMALFTRVGGARSAEVALLAGLATWAVGTWGHPFPGAFTASIVVSLVAYLLFAGIGPGPGRQRR